MSSSIHSPSTPSQYTPSLSNATPSLSTTDLPSSWELSQELSKRDPHPRFEPVEDEVALTDRLGEVIAGFDLKTGQAVSITQVERSRLGSPQRQAAFWKRVRETTRLSFPGLLKVWEIDEERGWIITDAVQGLWNPGAPIAGGAQPACDKQTLEHLLKALAYLHSQSLHLGIVHPENLCVLDDMSIVLRCHSPYSLADPDRPQADANDPFVPPEFLGDPSTVAFDASSDLYSLGVAICDRLLGGKLESLAGRDVRSGRNEWGQFISSDRPWEPIEKHSKQIAAPISTVVNRMVKKKSNQRYKNTDEALSGLKNTRPVATRSPLANPLAAAPFAPAATHPVGKNVVMQRSPLSNDVSGSHFKAINPVEKDHETRIEKLLSPERVYAMVKRPTVAGGIACLLLAFFLFSQTAPQDVPKFTVSIEVEDADGNPLPNATFTYEGGPGIRRTVGLGSRKSLTLKHVPQGTYDLTVSKPGFLEEKREGLEVESSDLPTLVFQLEKEPLIQYPVDVDITPMTADESKINFSFWEPPRSGSTEENLMGVGPDFRLDNIKPGTTRTVIVRAQGYQEKRCQIDYEDYADDSGQEIRLVLEREPRALILLVDRNGTEARINGKRLTDKQKTGTDPVDTYTVKVPAGQKSVIVQIVKAGYEQYTEEVSISEGKSDIVRHCSLQLLTPPEPNHFPVRLLKTQSTNVRVLVEGELMGVTPCTFELPDGRHDIELRHPSGRSAVVGVWFHPGRRLFKFDF